MFIDKEACLTFGLPEPKEPQSQNNYIINCLLKGYILDTRICRHIGIANLHSLKQELRKSINFMECKQLVYCPKFKIIPPKTVLIIYMTPDQIKQYLSNKKPA